MAGNRQNRLKQVAQKVKPAEEQWQLVVNWDEHPSPPEPGVIVVTWDDIDEGEGSERNNTQAG